MRSLVKLNNAATPTFFPFFDDFFVNDYPAKGREKLAIPAVNIKEDENTYGIEVAVPGLKKSDFKINIDEDVLTISYEKESEKEEVVDNYTRREFSKSSFMRRFTLPETVDSAKVSAAYNEGILDITLPKKEEAKPKPAINVKIK